MYIMSRESKKRASPYGSMASSSHRRPYLHKVAVKLFFYTDVTFPESVAVLAVKWLSDD